MPENLSTNLLDIDLNGPEAVSDPYPIHDRFRSQDSVHLSPHNGVWFISRYDDLISLVRDERMSSDRFRAMTANLPEEDKGRLSP